MAEGVGKAPGSGLSALQGNVFPPACLEGAFWGAPGVPRLPANPALPRRRGKSCLCANGELFQLALELLVASLMPPWFFTKRSTFLPGVLESL